MRIVLFHGFTGGRDTFAHLGIDAVTPELPGHGDAPDATGWDAALESLEAFLEPSPVVLAGYSMGARLALALALRHPRRIHRLVLASATAGIADPAERAARRREDEAWAVSIEQRGVPAFVERWEEHPALATLKGVAGLREQRLRHRPSGLASAMRHLGTGAMPPLWDSLSALDVPVRLLAGALDAKFSAIARRMQALLPRSELSILDGCGHAPHLEAPERFKLSLQGEAP